MVVGEHDRGRGWPQQYGHRRILGTPFAAIHVALDSALSHPIDIPFIIDAPIIVKHPFFSSLCLCNSIEESTTFGPSFCIRLSYRHGNSHDSNHNTNIQWRHDSSFNKSTRDYIQTYQPRNTFPISHFLSSRPNKKPIGPCQLPAHQMLGIGLPRRCLHAPRRYFRRQLPRGSRVRLRLLLPRLCQTDHDNHGILYRRAEFGRDESVHARGHTDRFLGAVRDHVCR
mmetsp:Transcript_23264/g.41598  ORF Transcript_23264/g.41598 Transcript_23264/m.41598 type:complete len:226 (+) Transcript_23264:1771-2448(+)